MDIDNIAVLQQDAPKMPAPILHAENAEHNDTSADDYTRKFDIISDRNAVLDTIAAQILVQPYDQLRIYEIINYIQEQQKLNADVYALLVEMNNIYADNLQS